MEGTGVQIPRQDTLFLSYMRIFDTSFVIFTFSFTSHSNKGGWEVRGGAKVQSWLQRCRIPRGIRQGLYPVASGEAEIT